MSSSLTDITRNKHKDPELAFRQLDDESQYKYLLLDSPMAETLFAKTYLDLELDPYQVLSLRFLRGRFASDEEVWRFINDNDLGWMFDNGWIRHGGNEGVSPYYYEKPNVLVLWPAGFGKALALDTPLATPDGWTTMGDVRVGDQLYDEQGEPCTVTYKSPVWLDRSCYAVSSGNSTPIIADTEHQWSVQFDLRTPPHLHTTATLAKPRRRRPVISSTAPLAGQTFALPVDPYVLGVWLGDGASAGGRIYQAVEDKPFIMAEFERRGYEVREHNDPIAFGVKGLDGALRPLGVLNNKHIPDQYLRASEEDRRDLLRGLVDTDGHVNTHTGIEFCSTNRRLADGVAELVRTLGAKAKCYTGRATIDGRDCGEKYRVFFYMTDGALLPRKREKCLATKAPRHYIDCTPAGRHSTACIQVDSPSHLYLAGEAMIPTHNTTLVSTRVLPVMEICDNPNARTQYIGKNENEAFSFSTNIRRELQNPKLVKDFGEFKPTDKSVPWSNQAFSVEQRQWRDVRENCEFYGTNSHAALGKRSDRVLIDDVETPDTARTPEMKNKLLEWCRIGPFTSARPLWNRNKKGVVQVPKSVNWSNTARYWGTGVVGTIFDPEALYGMIMRDPTFTCIKFDCFKDKKCQISLSDKMLTVKDLERERRSIGTLAFNKRYRNIAYNEEEMAFREAWVRGHEEEVNGTRIQHPGCLDRDISFGEVKPTWEMFCGFDPASGSKSRWSAHSAYVVLGYDKEDPEKQVHLIEYRKIQDNFDRMLDNLLDGNPQYGIEGLHSKYDYSQATVEANAFGTWLLNNDRMKPWIDRRVVVSHQTQGKNKSDPVAGVFSMGEMMQNGRFRIPYKTPRDQEIAEEFIGELLIFPKSTGDVVMALWLAQVPLRNLNTSYKSWFAPGGSGKRIHIPQPM